ncbi:MAG: trypsin-like peptidase domain-containing protein, partial [Phycisphaerales bacterium]|nr:trypsin-like peptidase domain-containing protein [Phycisphaerales bacterium]
MDAEFIAKRASGAASKAELEQTTEQAAAGHRTAIIAVVSVVLVLAVVLVSALIFTRDVEQLEQADTTQTERIEVVEHRADDAEEDLVSLGADLPEILEAARSSTYLVVRQSEDGGETAFGTAFVVAPGVLATNAHVAKWFDRLDEGDQLILRSAAEGGVDPVNVPVLSTTSHPGYDAFASLWKEFVPVRLNASNHADPVRSAGSACDLALLYVEPTSELGPPLPLASVDSHAILRPGQAIGSVGYPMEGMAMEGVNVQRPVPHTQIAHVTALTTFFNTSENEAEAGPGQRNVLLQHSLPATGGASGSPILNGRGEVVGVLSAVNFTLIGGQRIPSGVGVNFAQRATLLEELIAGQAHENLPRRLARWDSAVNRLYYSGRILRSRGGMEELVASWRAMAAMDLGPNRILAVEEIHRAYFPLTSLEAGRKAAGRDSAVYSTDLAFDVQGGVWYLLAATGDGSVDINVDEASLESAGIGEVKVLHVGEGTTGIAFRAVQSGRVSGTVTSDGGGHMGYRVLGGDSPDGPDAIIATVRNQWRDELLGQWGFGVRDIGGWLRDGQTGIDIDEDGFKAIEPIIVATEGEYLLMAVGSEGDSVGLKLWQVTAGERSLLAASSSDQEVAYVVFNTDKDAALEAEVVSDTAETLYALNLYRAVIRGDTDANDSVELDDLVSVIMEFGATCPSPDPCYLDVDEDGVVNVGDVMGVLGDYGAEWPARTHRFKAWTWGAVGLERADRLIPFTWAASWTPPAAVASEIMSKPAGDRVLFFFANISNSIGIHPDDFCQDGEDGVRTDFRSPWIDNGLAQVQADIEEFMIQFVAAGGTCDAVVIDNELTLNYTAFMDGGGENFQAIMNDPRFAELEPELGFSDLTEIGWGNERSREWDELMVPIFDAAVHQAVFQPVINHFPSAISTNYANQIISTENTTVGIAGHPKVRNGLGVGSHISAPFYPKTSQGCVQARPDGVHPVGGSDYAGFRLMVHWLRSIQASDTRPIMPWLTNLSWDSKSDV